MFGRKKRKQDTPEIQVTVNTAPTTSAGGYQPAELQVFDGKGHRAVMTFSADRNGQIVQRLKKNRDFKAHLKHIQH